MDVLYFLKQRTRFIRQHYETAAEPFQEIQRKIEAEEAPYIPEYSEDDDPPFLEEWLDAETSLQVLGRGCLSMLSASLKLYFQTWESELGIHWGSEAEKRNYFVGGFDPSRNYPGDVCVRSSNRQVVLDEAALSVWANSFGLGLTLFHGWETFVDQVLFWSALSKPVAATQALSQIHKRLIMVEVTPEAIDRWGKLVEVNIT